MQNPFRGGKASILWTVYELITRTQTNKQRSYIFKITRLRHANKHTHTFIYTNNDIHTKPNTTKNHATHDELAHMKWSAEYIHRKDVWKINFDCLKIIYCSIGCFFPRNRWMVIKLWLKKLQLTFIILIALVYNLLKLPFT